MNWREKLFNEEKCFGKVYNEGNGDIIISGTVNSNIDNPNIIFWAPSPADHLTSYSGSGLPFPNAEVAYQNTPNKGMVQAVNKEFTFRLKYPNAYYAHLGTLYIPPLVNIKVCDDTNKDSYITVQIDDGIPYRTLTYPAPPGENPYNSPLFFHTEEREVRTQEQILRDSSYPKENKTPKNWWGLKPPK
jgi:hypothetical protein